METNSTKKKENKDCCNSETSKNEKQKKTREKVKLHSNDVEILEKVKANKIKKEEQNKRNLTKITT